MTRFHSRRTRRTSLFRRYSSSSMPWMTLHPFEDGNGRIARVLTDMAMAQDDRQPNRLSSQIMAEREGHYDVLERCQKGNGDITEWLGWFLGCFCRAIDRSEIVLATVLDKAAFWKAITRHRFPIGSERSSSGCWMQERIT
jgi:Fic family protein